MEKEMDSKSRFYALEVMCRERARAADKESSYWLAEAEEWAQLRKAGDQQRTTVTRQFTARYPNLRQ
jgi:hypothetical protein